MGCSWFLKGMVTRRCFQLYFSYYWLSIKQYKTLHIVVHKIQLLWQASGCIRNNSWHSLNLHFTQLVNFGPLDALIIFRLIFRVFIVNGYISVFLNGSLFPQLKFYFTKPEDVWKINRTMLQFCLCLHRLLRIRS